MNIVILKKIGNSDHVSKRLSGISGPVPRFLEVINLSEEDQLELNAPDGFIVTAVTYDLIDNELIPTVHCNVFLGEDSIPDVIEDTRRYVLKRNPLKN